MEVLIELFTSPTCPHCVRARQVVERVVKQMPGVVVIEREVSSPENAELARRYGITAVPTMVINGRYVLTGVPSEERLVQYITKAR